MALTKLQVLRRWAHEPLCRFLLLGLAILAVDRALGGAGFGDQASSARIVVSASRQTALAEAFRAEHGRAPRADELQARLDSWIDEQVLYNEALALGLDRRDIIVRRQLTQKMLFLIEDNTLLPEPSEVELQTWLDQHAERYGHPMTVSFDQVFLSRGRHGDRLMSEAERTAKQLRESPQEFVGLGDPFLVGQVVADAAADRLRRDFGDGFAASLQKLPEGEWSGPIPSGFGLHLVRVTARGDFRPATLAEVAGRVRVDYRAERRAEQNRRALAELRTRYQIEIEDAAG